MSENGIKVKELKPKSKLKRFLCHPVTIAFGLNLVIMILSLVCFDAFYETGDEFLYDQLVSQFGEYHIPFMNYYLTMLIAKLYTVVSGVKVFSLILLISGYVSLSTIIFSVLKYTHKKYKYIFAALIESVVFFDMYVQIQWTKVSAVCMLAGICLIVCYALKNRKIILPILGSLFVLWGAIIRFSNFTVGLLFIAAFWFAKIVYDSFNNKKLFFEKALCISMTVILGVTAIAGYSINGLSQRFIYNDDYMKQYNELNMLRTKLVDYPVMSYNENKEAYNNIGISDNDYAWLVLWHMDYEGYLNKEKMEKIVSIQPKEKLLSKDSIKKVAVDVKQMIKDRSTRRSIVNLYILFILSAVLLFLYDYKKWPFIICLYGLPIAFYCYLSIIGRNIYRARFGVFLIPIVLCAFLIDDEHSCLFRKRIIGKKGITALLCSLLILFGAYQTRYVYKLNTVFRYEFGAKAVDTELEEFIGNNPQCLFFDTKNRVRLVQKSYMNVFSGEKPLNNLFLFGDWATGLKYEKEEFAKRGVENKYRDIIDNDKVYIIATDSPYDLCDDYLIEYIREHYTEEGWDVEYKLCKAINETRIYQVVSVKQ